MMNPLQLMLAQLEDGQLVRPLPDGDPTYIFKHALTRDTAYSSLLLRKRREIHGQIAVICERQYADNLDEYASLLAHHYSEAGETEKAIAYLQRAGERGRDTGAPVEAVEAFKRALALMPEANHAARADLCVRIGAIEERWGEYQAAAEWLQAGLELARTSGDDNIGSRALSGLATVAVNRGDYEAARQLAAEALARARQVEDRSTSALALRTLGIVTSYEGNYDAAEQYCQEGLALYRGLDDRRGINSCLNSLGIIALDQADLDAATGYLEEAIALSRETGDRHALAIRLSNLGNVEGRRSDFDGARAHFAEALAIAREIGSKEDIATAVFNLGDIAALQGDDETANTNYRDALTQAIRIGALPLALTALVGIAGSRARAGQAESAAEILGFALDHAASNAELKEYAAPALAALRTAMSRAELDAALECGKQMSLEEITKDMSADKGNR